MNEMKWRAVSALLACLALGPAPAVLGGTLLGHLRDPNWYARRADTDPFGTGHYEYAVNANGTNLASLGGLDDTDAYGAFQMPNLPAGSYTIASWDVWWRSAFAFNVPVPAGGNTPEVDLRLHATIWGYPAFWDDASYTEYGQTFVATGPIAMIYLRNPLSPPPTHTVTVHQDGPGGPQVGVTRAFNGYWDNRIVYGYGEMPTVRGQSYYLRIRSATPAVICQMDPRPDFSDPMPGGCLWLGGATVSPYPDRDLGVTIMADDDGLITDLFVRPGGTSFSGVTSAGQSFIARGVSLVSAAFWLADGTFPTYVVRVLENGPGGAQVGTTKRGKPARPSADPEMLVVWAPGECPLTPGRTYYLEVARDGDGTFNSVYTKTGDPFAYGQAYQNGVAVSGTDLAGTLMEEESPGSATQPAVKITVDPSVSEANRGSQQLTITWTTDVPSDSRVEFAAETPPYAQCQVAASLVTSHSLTITGLQSHTMYHYRVTSAATNYWPAISRDFVICTRPAAPNPLANPGFEEGSGGSPRSTFPGWVKGGSVDIRTADGSWFWGLQPRSGSWLLQGAVNGNASDGYIYQRVSGVTPGLDYSFSAWVMTAMRENSNWKYDVWDNRGRLIHVRLGIDPTGGTNVGAATVRWTPRMYSHRHFTQLARTAVAQSSNLTVFVHLKGDGGEWHNYAVDDCVLTHEEIPTKFGPPTLLAGGVFQVAVMSKANRTNVVEVSSTLTNWTPVTNFLNRAGTAVFTDTSAGDGTCRFFRARTVP